MTAKKTPVKRPLTHAWLISLFAKDERVTKHDLAKIAYWAMEREDAMKRILKFGSMRVRGNTGAEKFLAAAWTDRKRADRAYARAVAALNKKAWTRR